MSDVSNDAEADQGGSAGGSSPPDEKAGLISALQAERSKRHNLERDLATLKGTVDTLKQNQPQPKEHTKAELQAAVDAGRISQEGADQVLEEQRDRKLKAEIKAENAAENRQNTRTATVNAELGRFREHLPDLETPGSESRNAAEKAFAYQVDVLGKPNTVETELDALISVWGPSNQLQAGRKQEPETFQDVGSDGGTTTEVTGKPPKGLSADAKKYYGKQIENGMYEDWAAVTKELEHASAGPKRRLGA